MPESYIQFRKVYKNVNKVLLRRNEPRLTGKVLAKNNRFSNEIKPPPLDRKTEKKPFKRIINIAKKKKKNFAFKAQKHC